MKLWLDDLREPPDESWTWMKNSADALEFLEDNEGKITEVSLDHDLGGDDTARPVAAYIEWAAAFKRMGRIKWAVHSSNPPGRDALKKTLEAAEKFWKMHEEAE
jgi:hypothetical protein